MIEIRTQLHNEVRGGYNAWRASVSVDMPDGETITVDGEWAAATYPSVAIQCAYSDALRELMRRVKITDGGP